MRVDEALFKKLRFRLVRAGMKEQSLLLSKMLGHIQAAGGSKTALEGFQSFMDAPYEDQMNWLACPESLPEPLKVLSPFLPDAKIENAEGGRRQNKHCLCFLV